MAKYVPREITDSGYALMAEAKKAAAVLRKQGYKTKILKHKLKHPRVGPSGGIRRYTYSIQAVRRD